MARFRSPAHAVSRRRELRSSKRQASGWPRGTRRRRGVTPWSCCPPGPGGKCPKSRLPSHRLAASRASRQAQLLLEVLLSSSHTQSSVETLRWPSTFRALYHHKFGRGEVPVPVVLSSLLPQSKFVPRPTSTQRSSRPCQWPRYHIALRGWAVTPPRTPRWRSR